jgi:hypothetical protein
MADAAKLAVKPSTRAPAPGREKYRAAAHKMRKSPLGGRAGGIDNSSEIAAAYCFLYEAV